MRVTASKIMPPRLHQLRVNISTARNVSRDYQEYEENMAVFNHDGGGRVESTLR